MPEPPRQQAYLERLSLIPEGNRPSAEEFLESLKGLPPRIIRLLRRDNIRTIQDLMDRTDWDLYDIKGFREKALECVNACLKANGYPEIRKEYPKSYKW